jgi:hypothetical protein
LSDRARDAILGVIRVMVAEAATRADDGEEPRGAPAEPEKYAWAKTAAADGRTRGHSA